MVSTNQNDALSAQAWPVRFLRSLAAAGIGLTLAVGGHRAGGGAIAPGAVIAVAWGIVFAVALLLSARQLTAGQIVGLLLIAQIVVHVSCAFNGAVASFGPAMILGHVLATALTTGVLVRGERFLWTTADRIGLRSLPLFFIRVGVAGPTPQLQVRSQDVRLPLLLVQVGGNGLRGPPACCA